MLYLTMETLARLRSLPKEFLSASHALPSGIFWEARAADFSYKSLILLVGAARFELTTPCPPDGGDYLKPL
jgi:hypothetical protein